MITGIIMASGFSKRLKGEKLTLTLDGIPIIERVISTVKNSIIDDIIVVYRKEEIKEIGEKYSVKGVFNKDAHKGQSQALKIGILSCNSDTKGYMFFVGDQPLLDTSTVNRLIKVFKENPQSIVVPLYGNKRGNPVIFPCKFKDDLLNIEGDQGGKRVIDSKIDDVIFVPIIDKIIGRDIDTWEEYKILSNGGNFHG